MAKDDKHMKKSSVSKVKMPTLGSWLTNAGKSIGISGLEVIQQIMPSTFEVAEDAIENVHSLREQFLKSKSSKKSLEQFMDNSVYAGIGKKAVGNFKEALKTGKFYRSQQDRINDMNDGFDLDGFDFGDDMDWDTSFSTEDGSADVTVAGSSDHGDTDTRVKVNVDVGENSGLIGAIKGQTQVSTDIAERASQISKAQFNTFMTSFNQYQSNITGQMESAGSNIATIASSIGTISQHSSIAVKYYEDSMNVFNKLYESVAEIQKTSASRSGIGAERDPREYNDVMDIFDNGKIKFKGYFDIVKKNFDDLVTTNLVLSSVKNILDQPDILEDMFAHPTSLILEGVWKNVIGPTLTRTMTEFDNTLKGTLVAGLTRVANLEDDDNPIIGTLGKLFGVKNRLKSQVSRANYRRGKVDWDGESRKTLIEVIPHYLRKMTAALTGIEEQVYDYETGRFVGLDEAMKDYERIDHNRLLGEWSNQVSDFRYFLEDIKDTITFQSRQEKKNIVDAFDRLATNIVRMNGQLSLTRDSAGRQSSRSSVADILGLDPESTEVKAITAYLDNYLSRSDFMRLNGTAVQEARARMSRYKDEEETGDVTTIGRFSEDGDRYRNYNMRNPERTRDGKGGVDYKVSPFIEHDEYGRSPVYYLRRIFDTMLKGVPVFGVRPFDVRTVGSGGGNGGDDNGDDYDRHIRRYLADLKQDIADYDRDVADTYRRREGLIHQDSLDRAREQGSHVLRRFGDNTSIELFRTAAETLRANERSREEIDEITKAKHDPNAPGWKGVRGRIENWASKPREVLTSVFTKANEFLYELVFGENPVGKGSIINHSIALLGAKFNQFGTWLNKRVLSPMEDFLFGDDGIFTKVKQSQVAQDIKSGLSFIGTKLFGTKNGEGLREGGVFSSLVNDTSKELSGVAKSATESISDTAFNAITSAREFINEGRASGGTDGSEEQPKTVYEAAKAAVRDVTSILTDKIFGTQGSAGRDTFDNLTKDISENKGKILSGAVLGAGVGLLLPGSPLVAAAAGAAYRFIDSSEQFQAMLGIHKDEDGRFSGGLPAEIMNIAKDHGKGAAIGGIIGTVVGGVGTGTLMGILAGGLFSVLSDLDMVRDAVHDGATYIKDQIKSGWNWVTTRLMGVKDNQGNYTEGLGKYIQDIGEKISDSGTRILNNVEDAIHERIIIPVAVAMQPIIQYGKNLFEDVKATVGYVMRTTASFIGKLFQPIVDGMKEVKDSITSKVGKVLNTAFGVIGKIITSPFTLIGALGMHLDDSNEKRGAANHRKATIKNALTFSKKKRQKLGLEEEISLKDRFRSFGRFFDREALDESIAESTGRRPGHVSAREKFNLNKDFYKEYAEYKRGVQRENKDRKVGDRTKVLSKQDWFDQQMQNDEGFKARFGKLALDGNFVYGNHKTNAARAKRALEGMETYNEEVAKFNDAAIEANGKTVININGNDVELGLDKLFTGNPEDEERLRLALAGRAFGIQSHQDYEKYKNGVGEGETPLEYRDWLKNIYTKGDNANREQEFKDNFSLDPYREQVLSRFAEDYGKIVNRTGARKAKSQKGIPSPLMTPRNAAEFMANNRGFMPSLSEENFGDMEDRYLRDTRAVGDEERTARAEAEVEAGRRRRSGEEVEDQMAYGGTVPKTGKYLLSRGETVIPRGGVKSDFDHWKENQYRNLLGGNGSAAPMPNPRGPRPSVNPDQVMEDLDHMTDTVENSLEVIDRVTDVVDQNTRDMDTRLSTIEDRINDRLDNVQGRTKISIMERFKRNLARNMGYDEEDVHDIGKNVSLGSLLTSDIRAKYSDNLDYNTTRRQANSAEAIRRREEERRKEEQQQNWWLKLMGSVDSIKDTTAAHLRHFLENFSVKKGILTVLLGLILPQILHSIFNTKDAIASKWNEMMAFVGGIEGSINRIKSMIGKVVGVFTGGKKKGEDGEDEGDKSSFLDRILGLVFPKVPGTQDLDGDGVLDEVNSWTNTSSDILRLFTKSGSKAIRNRLDRTAFNMGTVAKAAVERNKIAQQSINNALSANFTGNAVHDAKLSAKLKAQQMAAAEKMADKARQGGVFSKIDELYNRRSLRNSVQAAKNQLRVAARQTGELAGKTKLRLSGPGEFFETIEDAASYLQRMGIDDLVDLDSIIVNPDGTMYVNADSKNITKLEQFLGKIGSKVKGAASKVGGAASKVASGTKRAARGVVRGAKSLGRGMATVGRTVAKPYKAIWGATEEFAKGLKGGSSATAKALGTVIDLPIQFGNTVKSVGTDIFKWTNESFLSPLLKRAKHLPNLFGGWMDRVAAGAKAMIDVAGNMLTSGFKTIGDSLANTFDDIGKKLGTKVKDVGKRVTTKVKDLLAKGNGGPLDNIIQKAQEVGTKAKEGIGKATKTVRSEAGKFVDDVGNTNLGTKVKNIFKRGAGGAADNVGGLADNVIGGAADDVTRAAASGGKGIKKLIKDAFSKLGKLISGVMKRFGGKAAKTPSTVGKLMETVLGLMTSAKHFADVSARVIKAAAGTLNVAMYVGGAVFGAANASNLFAVDEESVDIKMKAISAMWGGLKQSIPGTIIDIANELAASIMGINFVRDISTMLYKALASEEEKQAIDNAQEAFKTDYFKMVDKEYQEFIKSGEADKQENMIEVKDAEGNVVGYQRMTQDQFVANGKVSQSFEEYNMEHHKTMGRKIFDKFNVAGDVVKSGVTHVKNAIAETKDRKIGGYFGKDYWNVSRVNEDGTFKDEEEIAREKGLKYMQLPMEIAKDIFGAAINTFDAATKSIKTTVKDFAKNTKTAVAMTKNAGVIFSGEYWNPPEAEETEAGALTKIAFYLNRILLAGPMAVFGLFKSIGSGIGKVVNGAKTVFSNMVDDTAVGFGQIDGLGSLFKGSYWTPPTDDEGNPFSTARRITFYAGRVLSLAPALAIGLFKDAAKIFDPIIGPIKSAFNRFKDGVDMDDDNVPDASADLTGINPVIYWASKALALPARAMTFIGDFTKTKVMPVISTAGSVIGAIGSDILSALEIVGTNPFRVLMPKYWKYDGGDDNGLGGIRKALFYGTRVLMTPIAAPLAVIRKALTFVSPVIDTAVNILSNTVKSAFDITKAVATGNGPFSLDFWKYEGVGDDNIGFGILDRILFYGFRAITLPVTAPIVVLKHVAGFIKNFVVDFMNIGDIFSTAKNIDGIKSFGELFKAPSQTTEDETKPAGLLGNIVFYGTRAFMTIPWLFNKLFGGIADTFNGIKEAAGDTWNKIKGFFGFGGDGDAITITGGNGDLADQWISKHQFRRLGGNGGEPEIVNGMPYYSQNDPSIRNKDYRMSDGITPMYKEKMGGRGCGPTALSMVASALKGGYGNPYSPENMAELATEGGYSTNDGTTPGYFTDVGSSLGMRVTPTIATPENIYGMLGGNGPVIIQGASDDPNSPYTSSGHYVVATGVDKDGNVLINDPRGKKYSKAYPMDRLMDGSARAWGFEDGGNGSAWSSPTKNGTTWSNPTNKKSTTVDADWNTEVPISEREKELRKMEETGTYSVVYRQAGEANNAARVASANLNEDNTTTDTKVKKKKKKKAANKEEKETTTKASTKKKKKKDLTEEEATKTKAKKTSSKKGITTDTTSSDLDMSDAYTGLDDTTGITTVATSTGKKKGKGSASDWLGLVRAIKKAIAAQKPGYSQSRHINITINGKSKSVRTDCSGYVSACCRYYGVLDSEINSDGFTSKKCSIGNTGKFVASDWKGWDKLQEGDILARSGHVEIFAYNKDGSHYVYNCGSDTSVNSPAPTRTGHTSGYTTVWRPVDPGTGANTFSVDGSEVSSDGSTSSTTSGDNSSLGGILSSLATAMTKPITEKLYGKSTSSSEDTTVASDGTTAAETSGGLVAKVSADAKVEQNVWNYFKSKGYSDAATAGIMGNMYQESRMNPSLIQNGGTGRGAGIVQWEDYQAKTKRWSTLNKRAQKAGVPWTDLGLQLAFVHKELQELASVYWQHEGNMVEKAGTTKTNYNDWKNSTDVETATRQFEGAFERAGTPLMDVRIKAAKSYLQQYQGTENLAQQEKKKGKAEVAEDTTSKKKKNQKDTTEDAPKAVRVLGKQKSTEEVMKEYAKKKKKAKGGNGTTTPSYNLSNARNTAKKLQQRGGNGPYEEIESALQKTIAEQRTSQRPTTYQKSTNMTSALDSASKANREVQRYNDSKLMAAVYEMVSALKSIDTNTAKFNDKEFTISSPNTLVNNTTNNIVNQEDGPRKSGVTSKRGEKLHDPFITQKDYILAKNIAKGLITS